MSGGLPSKEKLRELGRSGLVAHSPLATRAAISGCVFATILVGFDRISGSLVRSHVELQPLGDLVQEVGEPFLLAVGILAAVGILGGVMTVLLQTRLVAGYPVLYQTGRNRRDFRVFVVLLELCVVGAAAMVCAYSLFQETLLATRIDSAPQIRHYFGALYLKICKVVVVVAAVLAILAMFVCRMVFLFRYRQKARHD
jgi:hypothetical protein